MSKNQTVFDYMDYSFCFDDQMYRNPSNNATNTNNNGNNFMKKDDSRRSSSQQQQHQQPNKPFTNTTTTTATTAGNNNKTSSLVFIDDVDDDEDEDDEDEYYNIFNYNNHRYDLKSNQQKHKQNNTNNNTSDDSSPNNEYRYMNDNSNELDKMKNRLTSLWNNVRYGKTTYSRKNKTNFEKNVPICILGKYYCLEDDNVSSSSPFSSIKSNLNINMMNKTASSPSQHSPFQKLTKNLSDITQYNSNVIRDDYCVIDDDVKKTNLKQFERDVYSRLWFTYRKDFPAIKGTRITSDCGWGCMLRSVQMLIAQGFLVHYFNRDWSFFEHHSYYDHILYHEIVSWFNDRPTNKSPFGLHNLLKIAEEKLGKKVGDWFGPSSVILLMRDALEQSCSFITLLENSIKIYVAQDCTIYKQDVIDLCFSKEKDTFVPCILLISVRLGGEELNEIYVPTLKLFLELDYCLGIIGGKPKHSLYFIGFQDNKVIYLDPHLCQDSINITMSKGQYFDTSSFHCDTPSKTPFSKLDPSLAIGFYCKTLESFEKFCKFINDSTKDNLKSKHNEIIYPIFSICDDRYEGTHGLNCRLLSFDESSFTMPSSLTSKQTNNTKLRSTSTNNNVSRPVAITNNKEETMKPDNRFNFHSKLNSKYTSNTNKTNNNNNSNNSKLRTQSQLSDIDDFVLI